MVKFGKKIESFHEQCVVYTIYLAVCEVLYSKKNEVVVEDADKQTTLKNWFIRKKILIHRAVFLNSKTTEKTNQPLSFTKT